jgi:hypothetical protein
VRGTWGGGQVGNGMNAGFNVRILQYHTISVFLIKLEECFFFFFFFCVIWQFKNVKKFMFLRDSMRVTRF